MYDKLIKAIENFDVKELPDIPEFIGDKVWEMLMSYQELANETKIKFFDNLIEKKSVEDYEKIITELWEIDHSFMQEAIEELKEMVMVKDLQDIDLYSNKDITEESIKLQNGSREFKLEDKDLYKLNPTSDFITMEKRFVKRNVKFYEKMLERYTDEISSELVRRYDKYSKTIPYMAQQDIYRDGELVHQKGDIVRYVDVSTYNSMLFNVNLTRSAWNTTMYDSKIFDNHLFYLPAHQYSCPLCMIWQGKVYADEVGYGYPLKEEAIEGGIGHPNCKHIWLLYWSEDQIARDDYNSQMWIEKYKTKQKIQNIDLTLSRLNTDISIYEKLGRFDLVDKNKTRLIALNNKKENLKETL